MSCMAILWLSDEQYYLTASHVKVILAVEINFAVMMNVSILYHPRKETKHFKIKPFCWIRSVSLSIFLASL